MKIVRVGSQDLVIWLHTAVDPSDTEWQAQFVELRHFLDSKSGGSTGVRGFAVSDGGGPNAKARHEINKVIFKDGLKLGAVSNVFSNPLKRGVVTAISWLNPQFKALQPREGARILEYLDCQAHTAEVWNCLQSMQQSLPTIISLRELGDALGLSVAKGPN
jgi:hypothetical protein